LSSSCSNRRLTECVFLHSKAAEAETYTGADGIRTAELVETTMLGRRDEQSVYSCERLLCDHCGAENPQTCVPAVQTRDIFVRFITAGGCSVQAVDLNLDRTLGPRVPVTSPEVLRRLLVYLGAMPEALREYDRSCQSHGKGNVRITLEPGRKNLLRLSE
jgi:hypothetical protein